MPMTIISPHVLRPMLEGGVLMAPHLSARPPVTPAPFIRGTSANLINGMQWSNQVFHTLLML